jgi:hypothetical protein
MSDTPKTLLELGDDLHKAAVRKLYQVSVAELSATTLFPFAVHFDAILRQDRPYFPTHRHKAEKLEQRLQKDHVAADLNGSGFHGLTVYVEGRSSPSRFDQRK